MPSALSPRWIDAYWRLAQTVASELLHVEPELVEELRKSVFELSDAEVDLFHHAEPLDVVIDLSRRGDFGGSAALSGSASLISRYLAMRETFLPSE